MKSIKEAQLHGRQLGLDPQEIDWILGFVLKLSTAAVVLNGHSALSIAQVSQVQEYFSKRLEGLPLAYVLGEQPFYKYIFKVNEHVLIPRSETECLVELALKFGQAQSYKVLELGTGSGCVAISLALERPLWRLTATDLSHNALAVAQWNAKALGADLKFVNSDWFSNIHETGFDLIISNPPYIDEHDPHIDESVRDYEPHQALFSCKGTADLEQIIQEAFERLKPGSWLLLEHGFMQAEQVAHFMKNRGYVDVTTHYSLASHPRVTAGMRPSF